MFTFIYFMLSTAMGSSSYATYVSRHVCSHDVMYECEVASLLIWSSVVNVFRPFALV